MSNGSQLCYIKRCLIWYKNTLLTVYFEHVVTPVAAPACWSGPAEQTPEPHWKTGRESPLVQCKQYCYTAYYCYIRIYCLYWDTDIPDRPNKYQWILIYPWLPQWRGACRLDTAKASLWYCHLGNTSASAGLVPRSALKETKGICVIVIDSKGWFPG